MKRAKRRSHNSLLQRLWASGSGSNSAQRRRRIRAARFEPLEQRFLLAADLGAALDDDPLLGAEVSAIYDDQLPAAEGEGVALGEGEAASPSTLAEFVDLLAQKTRFFGAFWCPHCIRQHNVFGDLEGNLPFIEVTAGDPAELGSVVLNAVGRGEDLTLNPTGREVASFPTWERVDNGDRITGYQTIGQLAEFADIPLPPDILSIDTNLFDFDIQLRPDVTPITVDNFLNYVNDGDYDNSIFHRWVPGFVLQGGGFTSDSTTFTSANQFGQVPTDAPIVNEFDNYAKEVGTGATLNKSSGVVSVPGADLSTVVAGDQISVDLPIRSDFFDIQAVDASTNTLTLSQTSSSQGIGWSIDGKASGFNVFPSIQGSVELGPGVDLSDVEAGDRIRIELAADTHLYDITQVNDTFDQLNVTPAAGNTSHANLSWTIFPRVNRFLTLSMAKLGGNPNSATNNFFLSVVDTDSNLDLQNEGFTVFGHALDEEIVDSINTLTPSNVGAFSDLPLAGDQLLRIESIAGSGTVSGVVFSDIDRDGVLDPGENGIASVQVFADANGDSILDDDEFATMTAPDGSYSLVLPAGQHVIRQVRDGNTLQTAPITPDSFTVNVEIGREVTDVRFGNFTVGTLSVDLLDSSDTGVSSSDNITSLNNSSDSTLQFLVSGTEDGAIVNLFADGTLIGEATATGGAVTVTTNGTATLADGIRSIFATQEVAGIVGPQSAALSLTVDTTQPADFTSTPPASGVALQGYVYDVDSPEEGAGIRYTTNNAPNGVVLNETTGVLTWTPSLAQVQSHTFEVVATDLAGNSRTQSITVNVTKEPLAAARLKITSGADHTATEISEVAVGETFVLHVLVRDLRENPRGVFAFYQDVVFDENLASARSLSYGDTFPNDPSGTIQPGLVDEFGAFTTQTDLAGGEFLLGSIEFQASRSGQLQIVGNPADIQPNHDVLLLGINAAIPQDEVLFGETALTINPTFGANADIFNFNEDSSNNTLDVLFNDTSLSGSTDNLTITGVSPVAGQQEIVGDVTIAADGRTLSYTPPADFNGEVTFDYSLSDGNDTLNANVIVQVFPVNDDPTANADTFNFAAGSHSNFLDVLTNDTTLPDEPNEAIDIVRISPLTLPVTGSQLEIGTGRNHLLYTPAVGFAGIDQFTYDIEDENGGTSQATITIEVTGAADDRATVTEDTTDNSIDVLVNDIGEGLTITSVGDLTGDGTVTIAPDNLSILFTPGPDQIGFDSFTYTTTDSDGGSATATVLLTIENTNDPPTANTDTFTVREQTSGNSLNPLSNDNGEPDPPGETLTIVAVGTETTLGSVAIAPDGQTVTYTPPNDFGDGISTGVDTFTYTIDDGTGETATATATVNVVEFDPASLSGFVYFDTNNNGVFEDGEQPIEDVRILLEGVSGLDGSNISQQAESAADGSYRFLDLPPGNWVVTQVQPTGQQDGLPIVDGRDTIGSQGGDDSVNDQFTVVLAEGVDGIQNNFAELFGRTLSGRVHFGGNSSGESGDGDSGSTSGGVLFGGFRMRILLRQPDGTLTEQATVVVNADGTFSAPGLPDGDYELSPEPPAFLVASNDSQDAAVGGADSSGNSVSQGGLHPRYVTRGMVRADLPTQLAHVAVQPGVNGQHWFALGDGWQVFESITFEISADGQTLNIDGVVSGQTMSGSVSMSDPRVEVIAQDGGVELLRLASPHDAFLSPSSTRLTGGEGETAAPSTSDVTVPPTSVAVTPPAESESQPVTESSGNTNITMMPAVGTVDPPAVVDAEPQSEPAADTGEGEGQVTTSPVSSTAISAPTSVATNNVNSTIVTSPDSANATIVQPASERTTPTEVVDQVFAESRYESTSPELDFSHDLYRQSHNMDELAALDEALAELAVEELAVA